MSKQTITITMTLEVEAVGADVLSISVAAPTEAAAATSGAVPGEVIGLIEDYATPSMAPFLQDFAERCVAELQLNLERPESGSRKYVNGYPPKRYGAKRAVAFDARSGRAEIYCSPDHAATRSSAEPVLNNGVPFAVKVYLQSAEAVAEAVELTRLGLEERVG